MLTHLDLSAPTMFQFYISAIITAATICQRSNPCRVSILHKCDYNGYV